MPSYLLTLSKRYILAISLLVGLGYMVPVHATSNPPTLKPNSVDPTQRGKVLIPADGNCLYTSVVLGYLMPVVENEKAFNERLDALLSYPLPSPFKRDELQEKHTGCAYLRDWDFQDLVSSFLRNLRIKPNTWGGNREMKNIANKLKINLKVYTPGTQELTRLVEIDEIKPNQGTNTNLQMVVLAFVSLLLKRF